MSRSAAGSPGVLPWLRSTSEAGALGRHWVGRIGLPPQQVTPRTLLIAARPVYRDSDRGGSPLVVVEDGGPMDERKGPQGLRAVFLRETSATLSGSGGSTAVSGQTFN
jgi:hypothetical protein